MLDPKVVPSDGVNGLGVANVGASGIRKGSWVKLDGAFSSGDVTALGTYAHFPGYGRAGDPKWSTVAATGLGTVLMGMVNKLEYVRQDSNITLDYVYSGEMIQVYTKGEFETDQYATADFANTVTPGTLLYVNANGVLATGYLSGETPRAVFLWKKSSYNSNYTSAAAIYIKLLD